MGVHGLTSYVEGNRQYFTDLKLRNSHLVIDGCSLYFRLYFNSGLDQVRGGDYDQFATLVRRFFAALFNCDIRPFVVLDGGMDQSGKKFKTIWDRAQSKIREAHSLSRSSHGSVLPLLTRDVFRQVLYELGVPLAQCISEADFEIASLARQWGCPVLTNDSDFYIFDLPAGYLPFTFFEWENICGKATERYLPARRYLVNRFCSHFNHINKQLLPLFAVIIGNDYTPAGITESFFSRVELQRVPRGRGSQKSPRIEGMLLWLSRFSNTDDALEEVLEIMCGQRKGKIRKQLLTGMQDYQLPLTSKLARFFSSPQSALPDVQGFPEALASQPEWFLRAVTSGRLPPMVLDVLLLQRTFLMAQVENSGQPSSHTVSLGIRKAMYGLVLLDMVGQSQRQSNSGQAQRGQGRGRGGKGGREQSAPLHINSASCAVEEYDRLDLNLRTTAVEPHLPNSHPQLKLSTVDKQPCSLSSSLAQVALPIRLRVLLGTLGTKEHLLQSLPPHLCLPVCVTHFWAITSKPRPSRSLLQSVMVGLVYGELCRRRTLQGDPLYYCAATASLCQSLDQLRLTTAQRRGVDLRVAHSLSQWQSCMWVGLYLNQLLCLPLPEPHCACLFSGTLLHGVEVYLRGGQQQVEVFLAASPAALQLYSALLAVVTESSSQLHAPPPKTTSPNAGGRGQGRRGRGQGRGARGRGDQGRGGASSITRLDNKFRWLNCEDESDDDE